MERSLLPNQPSAGRLAPLPASDACLLHARHTFVSLAAAILMAGCASTYVAPPSRPSAELYLQGESGPGSTMTRNVYMFALKDTECHKSDYGALLGKSISNEATTRTESARIRADEPFVFTAAYMDARFAQNRACAVTAVFTPKGDHNYAARLVVSQDVTSCELGVYDLTDGTGEPIDLTLPKYVCDYGEQTTRQNGQPLRIQWHVLPFF